MEAKGNEKTQRQPKAKPNRSTLRLQLHVHPEVLEHVRAQKLAGINHNEFVSGLIMAHKARRKLLEAWSALLPSQAATFLAQEIEQMKRDGASEESLLGLRRAGKRLVDSLLNLRAPVDAEPGLRYLGDPHRYAG